MRSIPAQLVADFQSDRTSIAFLWTVEKADGTMIRGTEHDQDITLGSEVGISPSSKYAGTYYAVANVTLGDVSANTDLSVDNLEVTGAIAPKGSTLDSPALATVLDVRIDDIESGLLDQAPVSVIVTNWMDPSHGYFVIKAGSLGVIKHDSDNKYTTEVRGLAQKLAQTVIRTFSTTCNVVRFGDHRCRLDVDALAETGTVVADAGNNRLQFKTTTLGSSGSPPVTYPFTGGTLTFTSGLNAGFSREIKLDPNVNGGIALFWEQFPEDVQAGDAFSAKPGCDRLYLTCRDIYNNLEHIRAPGYFIPGVNALTAGPTTVQGLS